MGFAQDAQLIEDVVRTRDPAFAPVPKAALSQRLSDMWDCAAQDDVDTFLLSAMRLVALAQNAHSRVIPNRAVQVLPLRIVLRDGAPCLVDGGTLRPLRAVNGVQVLDLSRAWCPYLAGNPARQAVLAGLMLAWPAALALGGVTGPAFVFSCADGSELCLNAADVVAAEQVFSENETGAQVPHTDACPAPLIAREGPIWRVRMGDLKALTVPDIDAAVSALRSDPSGVVIDLRGNPGGSFLTALPLVRCLADPAFGQRCAVLVNTYTFSAAIVTAALIAVHLGGRAALFGAQMGDDLAFWAEGDLLELPQSGARLRYATGWHDWRTGRPDPTTPPEIEVHMVAAGNLHVHEVAEQDQMAAARAFVLDN